MAGTPDIILVIGQSNAAGRGVVDAGIDTADGRVTQFDGHSASATYRQLIAAADPLRHPEPNSTGVGPAMFFAKRHSDLTGHDVVLVPCAWGGTSLVGGTPTWSPGGRDRENAVDQANRAIAAVRATYPTASLTGMLMIQGESDADAHVAQADYQRAAWWLAQDLRERITGAADAWVVIGQMLPEAIAANIDAASGSGTYPAIDAAHTALGAKLRRCAKVGIGSGYAKPEARLLHYAAAGARLMGTTMADAVATAAASAGEAVPGQVTGLTAGASTATTQPLTWTAPASGGEVLDYVVERSAAGAGAWTAVSDGISTATSYTAVGLTGGTAYDWRVTARGYGGAGAPSATVTATTPAATTVPVRLQSITGGKVVESGSGELGFNYGGPSGAAAAAFATDHAGVSTHKLPAGVDGAFRINTGPHWTNSSSSYATVLLGVVKSASDPAYNAGAATGYSPAGVMLHTGNTYRLIVAGASSSTAPTTTVTAQPYDWIQIRRTGGRLYAEVARQATPDTWTVIYDFGAGNVYAGDLWVALAVGAAGTAPARTYGPLLGVNVSTGLPAITGTLQTTEPGPDTCTIVGTVGAAGITGALQVTEPGPDTCTIVGSVLITGALAATEPGPDTCSIVGTVGAAGITGALQVTEPGPDTCTIVGSVLITGALAATEPGPDTCSIVGTVGAAGITGALQVTEPGPDTCVIVGGVAITGVLAATEPGPDICSIVGTVGSSPAQAYVPAPLEFAVAARGVSFESPSRGATFGAAARTPALASSSR